MTSKLNYIELSWYSDIAFPITINFLKPLHSHAYLVTYLQKVFCCKRQLNYYRE